MSNSTQFKNSDGAERRRAPRVQTHFDIRWKRDEFDTTSGIEVGTISDISCTGCFVFTGSKLPLNEIVNLFIPLKEEAPIYIRGEVIEIIEMIGFTVRFIVSQTDEWKIEKLASAYNFPLNKD